MLRRSVESASLSEHLRCPSKWGKAQERPFSMTVASGILKNWQQLADTV